MSLFAGNQDAILTFYIMLKDTVALAALQAKYPTGVARAPYDPNVNGTGVAGGASVEFGAPWKGFSKTDPIDAAPYSWTPWHVAPGDATPFPTNVATFTRHSGGFFGIGGTDTTYHWIGLFKLAEPSTDLGQIPALRPTVPTRRWVEGWEVPNGGLAFPGNSFPSRDAARHVGGIGLALRNPNNSTQIALTIMGGAGDRSWERMYVRLRRKPDLAVGFWSTAATISAACGIELQILPDGHIGVVNIDSLSTRTLIGTVDPGLKEWTGAADDHAWHKLDMLVVYNASTAVQFDGVAYGLGSSAKGLFRLYLDGVSVFQATGAAIASGLSNGGAHVGSRLGQTGAPAGNNLELDIDEWINSDIPVIGVPAGFSPNGVDFMTGSKVQLLRPKAFGPNHNVLWAGDVRVPAQLPGSVTGGAASLTSATANAIAEVNVDDDMWLDADGAQIGVPAFVVHAQSVRGATSGKLGYILNTAVPVDVAVAENNIRANTKVLYSLNGTVTNPKATDITPIALRLTKGNVADAASLQTLVASAEILGLWGPEDYRKTETPSGAADPTFENFVGQHNAPYPHSVYARGGAAPPVSPYIIKSGTYVGNGTGLDLVFRAPVNWIYIRNTASHAGFMWFPPMLAAHQLFQQGVDAELVNAEEDLSFVPAGGVDAQQEQYRVRLAGALAALNSLGVTYQYTAVSDPGMRFMLNGAMAHLTGLTVDAPLINTDFLPEFLFLWAEELSNTATLNLLGKGVGNAAATITKLNGGAIANALTFGAGKLTIQTALIAGTLSQLAFSAWRRHDGNNDPGEGGVFAHGTWIGDGSASHGVTFGSAGKRPIWVMVFPEAGTGAVRDVSHTGVNSTTNLNANSTTCITAGAIDGFTVGVTLNTNGVVYNYFVLMGDATAGNGGFGVNGEFIPVQSDIPQDGPFAPFPNLDAILAADGTTGTTGVAEIPDDITTDLADTCIVFTTAICNLALSRLGVSKKIAALASELTLEAEMCRLHYGIDVGQTLRDVPWPFATRYAPLVLVAGTSTVPVNADWQYAYRAPSNMLFARRICGQSDQRRAYDPMPITFREGSDATGNLIYTNAALDTVPVVLEYTLRLPCPASSGDPLFRSALAWRLAASLAPTLSRDAGKGKDCLAMYAATLRIAETKVAQEQQQDPDGDADWISGRL